MKKTLYLMRHGETLFNTLSKLQGWSDSPLTEKGIRQAEIAGRYFTQNHITFDHAYSSSSERACDTLEAATGGKLPYTRVKGLKEICFGKMEGQDICLKPPQPYGSFFKQFGGESCEELQRRITDTLTELMEREDHHTVLAVSHGAACLWFAWRWAEYSSVHCDRVLPNCTIFRYEYEDGIFRLEEIICHDFSELE